MIETVNPSRKELLWHGLRTDLHNVVPGIADEDRLMCACCGRLLRFDDFSVEHIIPQQALKDDPPAVASSIPAFSRSGYTLLCRAPLKLKGKSIIENGCNGWKGRYYDGELRKLFNGTVLLKRPPVGRNAMVAAIAAAFLALFSRFGYQVSLSTAGLLLRRQFFLYDRHHKEMPLASQMILLGSLPASHEADHEVWASPFGFGFEEPGLCHVTIRNYVLALPISRDPRLPISQVLKYVPSHYKMRPDFRAFFD